MKNFLVALLLSVAALTVSASPALAEKQEFCQTVAGNWQAGADARKLGLSEDELDARIMIFVMNLINQGMPEPMIHMLVDPILSGYFGVQNPKAFYDDCMERENI